MMMQGKDGAHWAGVDWGQRVHDVCVLDAHGEVLAERRFDHSSKGLGELSAFLSGFVDVQVKEIPTHGRTLSLLGAT
jgi:hypothetical protein